MSSKIFNNAFIKNVILHKNTIPKYIILFNSAKNSTEAKSCSNVIRHNFHADCEEGINHQIHQEFSVSYIYLYMASTFSRYDIALLGFSNYFRKAAHEELQHAQILINFLNKRGGQLVLKTIAAPEKKDWSSPVCAVQCSIDLEKQVTQSLEALHERGQKHKDHHLCDFIESCYLTEQYEAIKSLGDLLTNLKRAGPGLGTIIIDQQLQKHASNVHDFHNKNNHLNLDNKTTDANALKLEMCKQ